MQTTFKFIISFMIIIMVSIGCSGCFEAPLIPEDEYPIGTQEYKSILIIEEVSENSILCQVSKSNTKIRLPNWFDSSVDLRVGSFITVSHNGVILETYPGKYHCIYYMEYTTETGELIHIENPVGAYE